MFGLTSPLIYVIAFLLATNIVAGIGWKVSASSAEAEKQKVVACQEKHKALVDQTAALGEIFKAKAKIKERQNAQIAEDTSNGWAAALERVRAIERDKRLRDATSRGAVGSGLSAPAQDRPGNALSDADAIPSPARVAADCAETTVTANFLQSYIERIEAIHE